MNSSKNNWSSMIYVPGKIYLVLIIGIAIIISAVFGYLTPKYITNLYASYTSNGTFENAFWALATIYIFSSINRIFYQLSVNKYIQHLIQQIRAQSYHNWLTSYETIRSDQTKVRDQYPLGEVISRIMNDTEAIIELITSGAFGIFIEFAFIISCLVSFVTLNTTSGIFLIVMELLACAFLIWGSKYMGRVYLEVRRATGMMSRMVANLTGGFPHSFYTPSGNYSVKKSEKSFDDFLNKQLKANVYDASYYSIAESLFPILVALLIVIFPYSGIVEMAIFAAIIDLIQRSIAPIKDIAGKVSSVQRARAGMIRIVEFNKDLETLPQVDIHKSYPTHEIESLKVDIPNFSYASRNEMEKPFSLNDICFTGKKGELIGIVGKSGCGKSTLLKILSTNILADEAILTFKMKDGRELLFDGDHGDIAEYKNQVSIVSQDSHVFTAPVYFNISLQEEVCSEIEKFWNEVLEEIPYIKRWGITLESAIHPKELSLGQKQILSALRSCFLKRPIVLFDEISSGLDSDVEYALRKLVLIIQKHSLTIIVAHRVETITKADQILVMDAGRVTDTGTHEHLINSSQTYQSFMSELKQLV